MEILEVKGVALGNALENVLFRRVQGQVSGKDEMARLMQEERDWFLKAHE
jgi:hypothetical protein